MTKIHPNGSGRRSTSGNSELERVPKSPTTSHHQGGTTTVLTVWKKSLLLSCQGFTVFDPNGSIIFRVDNYLAGNKAHVVLMDASGKSLLTIRRKMLTLADNWLVYDGDTTENPRYSVTKHYLNWLNNSKTLAHVTSTTLNNKASKIHIGEDGSSSKSPIYEIEGSYARRSCSVYDSIRRKRVAEIKRKEAGKGMILGVEVFSLIVQKDEIDLPFAMAFVLLLDQMFGSSSR